MPKINIIPAPGFTLVKPSTQTKPLAMTLSNRTDKRIASGEIIAIGADDFTVYGIAIKGENYGKVGDIIDFFHYYDEGQADFTIENGIRYYYVKFQDIRGTKS